MSNYLDAIPQAVATIVSACVARSGVARNEGQVAAAEQWVVELTDRLTRTLAKALSDAQEGKA